MLDGLERIDWTRLRHAHGPATEVPRLIRTLATGGDAEVDQALYDLFGTIWHQGAVYEATSYATPFLLELLGDPATRKREHLALLVASIANGAAHLDRHRDAAAPVDDAQLARDREWAAAARASVRRRLDAVLPLLDDPAFRLFAAAILAAFADEATRLLPPLGAALAGETAPGRRATIGLALACLGEVRHDAFAPVTPGPVPQRRLAALAEAVAAGRVPRRDVVQMLGDPLAIEDGAPDPEYLAEILDAVEEAAAGGTQGAKGVK
jgi:hypothetical protein